MREIKNKPLTKIEIESIAQKASGFESRKGKVECVIREVKGVSSADPEYQKSCVIHVLVHRFNIGPHKDVLYLLGKAFPQT